MDFSWDETKATSNLAKHGVSFEEATEVFADPLALVVEDVEHQERLTLIGKSVSDRLVLVVFIERDDEGIRIISARRATPQERKHYEEGN